MNPLSLTEALKIPTFVLEGTHFHYTPACTKTVGPKGGIHEHYELWRKNGKLQFPNHSWQLPIKHGLYAYGYITPSNVHLFHREEDCPCKS